MRDGLGLPYEDIATEMGTSVEAVETLLFRARRSAKEAMGRVGGRRDLAGLGLLGGWRRIVAAVRRVAERAREAALTPPDWIAPAAAVASAGLLVASIATFGGRGTATSEKPGRVAAVAASGGASRAVPTPAATRIGTTVRGRADGGSASSSRVRTTAHIATSGDRPSLQIRNEVPVAGKPLWSELGVDVNCTSPVRRPICDAADALAKSLGLTGSP